MQKDLREVRHFFYSQAFADGLRASLVILTPALLGYYIGYFDAGLTISIGAMANSLTDAPGPLIQRRNGMLYCACFAFIVVIITAFARGHTFTMALEIVVITFFFSMFTVYGNRATSVGNVAILVMILTMDVPLENSEVLPYAFRIFLGGMFYMAVSLALHFLRPYRIGQRVFGECIREIATYLSIRADFYNPETDLDDGYRKLFQQQVVVNEKQDAVREIFFKTRQIVEESTVEGRKLVYSFVETVDLFEDITASYYDYELLRKQFRHTGALELIGQTLKKIVRELDQIGLSMQSNSGFTAGFDYGEEVRSLKQAIDSIQDPNKLVLRKIIVNIRNLLADLSAISEYFGTKVRGKKSPLDHAHFVSHQSLDPKIIVDNLSLKSSVFRHAVRVSLACLAGFVIAKLISYGHHSYWILLTISFILKPAFSLTKQRNIERMIGTLIGGGIGVLILVFIPDRTAQFVFLVLFMIGTYSFMRVQYLVMVIFATPYILILLSFLGSAFKDVATERILDTLIGGAIAFLISYFLFPSWESEQIRTYMQGILRANATYLAKTLEALTGQKVGMLEYKLARKDVYLNSANLSAAFQRMLSEPKSKQTAQKQIHQFVVMNHILFSNIATITTTLLAQEPRSYPKEMVHQARKAYVKIRESADRFDPEKTSEPTSYGHGSPEPPSTPDEILMLQQLQFITKLSNDLEKTTTAILGKE